MFIQTHVTRLKATTILVCHQRRRQLVIDKFHQKRKRVANVTQKKKSEAGWWSDRLPTCRGLGPVSLPAITLRSDSSFLMHSQDRKRFHSRKFLWLFVHTPDVRKNAMHQCKQAKVHDRHVPIWSVRVDVGYKPRSFCRRRKVVSLPTFRWRISPVIFQLHDIIHFLLAHWDRSISERT